MLNTEVLNETLKPPNYYYYYNPPTTILLLQSSYHTPPPTTLLLLPHPSYTPTNAIACHPVVPLIAV